MATTFSKTRSLTLNEELQLGRLAIGGTGGHVTQSRDSFLTDRQHFTDRLRESLWPMTEFGECYRNFHHVMGLERTFCFAWRTDHQVPRVGLEICIFC